MTKRWRNRNAAPASASAATPTPAANAMSRAVVTGIASWYAGEQQGARQRRHRRSKQLQADLGRARELGIADVPAREADRRREHALRVAHEERECRCRERLAAQRV